MPLSAAEIFQFFPPSEAAAEIFPGFLKKFLLIEKFSNKKGKNDN
jgi:hypothetical protein